MTQKQKSMNKKGNCLIYIVLWLMIILLVGFGIYDYYNELKGSEDEEIRFCKELGYSIMGDKEFLLEMACYKIDDEGVKRIYKVEENNRGFYLRELVDRR